MKKIILLLGILVSITAAHVALGQVTEGVISYEDKINVHRTLPEDRKVMKDMIPEFRIMQKQLAFNADESLYKRHEDDVEEEDLEGPGVKIRFGMSEGEFYVNQAQSRRVILQEFMGKKYLIEDSLKIIPWKFSDEAKEIKGYLCKKAGYYNEERKQNITAWYTDKLRPFLGPESFTTLPGAVLMIDVNDGERVITATKVEARPLKKNDLKLTSGGIKTTEEEFKKTRKDHMDKMKANGSNVMIRN